MRLVVEGLAPGIFYGLQLRSVNGEEKSEWSETFIFQTETDVIPPAIPENLDVTIEGDSFIIKWDKVTENEDGSPCYDFSHYLVRVENDLGDFVVFEPTSNQMNFGFNDNLAAFGEPSATIKVRVASADKSGNVSEYSNEVIATNPPPPPPTDVTLTAGYELIIANWAPPVGGLPSDFQEYRVYLGTTDDFDPTAMLWAGVATNYSHTIYTPGSYYIKVVTVDKFGSESEAVQAGPVTPRTSTEVDVTPPDPPVIDETTITTVDGVTGLNVEWTAPANPDLDISGYTIAYREVGGIWSNYNATHEDDEARIQPIKRYKDYQVRMRTYDFSANNSAWTTIVNVAGETNLPPATPTNVSLSAAISTATMSWDSNVESDFKEYEVQYSTATPTGSDPIYKTSANVFSFSASITEDTTYYARVRAVDDQGLVSAWSNVVSGTLIYFPDFDLSDGVPPSSSPAPSVKGGFGTIFVNWAASLNPDRTTYDVHLGTTTGFTPDAGNRAVSTDSTFTVLGSLPSGGDLSYGVNYYVKIVARDADGSASPSAASAAVQVQKVDLGDVVTTDGNPPASSPQPTARAGIKHFFVTWPVAANSDPVVYELHVGTTTGFTPGAGTRIADLSATALAVSKLPNGNDFAYSTNYFFKIIAKDTDGAAAASAASSAAQLQPIANADIDFDAIAAELPQTYRTPTKPSTPKKNSFWYGPLGQVEFWNGTSWAVVDLAPTIIANGFISNAMIADAAITTAKIGDAQIVSAKIKDGEITNAKIDSLNAGKINAGILDAERIGANSITIGKIAPGQVATPADVDAARQLALDAAKNAENVLANPGFEYDFSNWGISAVPASITISTDEKHSGTKSMQNTSNENILYGSDIPVVAGQTWVAGAMFKADALTGNINTTGIRVDYWNGSTWTVAASHVPLLNESNWHNREIEFVIPSGVTVVRFGIRSNITGGTFWVDDTYLKNLTDAKRLAKEAELAAIAAAEAARKRQEAIARLDEYIANGTNLIQDPSTTGSISQWTNSHVGAGTSSSSVAQKELNGKTISVVESLSSGSVQNFSSEDANAAPIDPTKCYAVSIWIWDDAPVANPANNQFYFGVRAIDSTGLSNIDQINLNTLGVTNNSNAYFRVGTTSADMAIGQWRRYIGIIYPTGITPAAVAGTGLNVTHAMRFDPSHTGIVVRFLNYNNAGVERKMYAGQPTLVEVPVEVALTTAGGGEEWEYNNSTLIDGGNIYTGTVAAQQINVQDLVASDAFINNLTVNTANIVNAAITTAKIDNLAVTTAKINNLAVNNAKIANLAVDTAKIADLAVTNAKIATLEVNKLTAGTGLIADLTVKSSLTMGDAATEGIIKSFNYVQNVSGYRLTKNSLEINDGSISARSLKLQTGVNMMAPEYADFELTDYYYSQNMYTENMITAVNGDYVKFNKQKFTCVWGAQTQDVAAYMARNTTDYNIDVEEGKEYIVSAYICTTGTVATNVRLKVKWNTGAITTVNSVTPPTQSAAWIRLFGTVTAPAEATRALVIVDSPTRTNLGGFSIDGIQFEEKTSSLDTPSAWKPPAFTSIDGGLIRTGEIRSNTMTMVNGVQQPNWSINTNGGAQFASAAIRGTLVVGGAGDGSASLIQSYGFETQDGYRLNSNGDAVFQKIDVQGGSVTGEFRVTGLLRGGPHTSFGYGWEADSSGIWYGRYGSGSNPSRSINIFNVTSSGAEIRGEVNAVGSDGTGVHVRPNTDARSKGEIEFSTTSGVVINPKIRITVPSAGAGDDIGGITSDANALQIEGPRRSGAAYEIYTPRIELASTALSPYNSAALVSAKSVTLRGQVFVRPFDGSPTANTRMQLGSSVLFDSPYNSLNIDMKSQGQVWLHAGTNANWNNTTTSLSVWSTSHRIDLGNPSNNDNLRVNLQGTNSTIQQWNSGEIAFVPGDVRLGPDEAGTGERTLRFGRNTIIQSPSGSTNLDLKSRGAIYLHSNTSGSGNNFLTGNNVLYLGSTNEFRVSGLGDRTATSTVNAIINSSGEFYRSSSLREYKIAIEPLEDWTAIKQLEPVTYYDKGMAERRAEAIENDDLEALKYIDHLTMQVGLIAEDVYDAGVPLVTYNGDGSMAGVAYERVGVALIPWIKELEGRILELERLLADKDNA